MILDLSFFFLGAALPLSIAATNAALGLMTFSFLLALSNRNSRSGAVEALKSASRTPLFAVLALYAAAGLAAGLAGLGPAKSMSIWPKDLHKLWVVILVGATLNQSRRLLFARGLSAGAFAAALFGIAQSLGGETVARAHGFIHPVSYGESLGLIFLGLLLAGEDFLPPAGRYVGLGTLALALVFNQTRAAQIGIAAGLAAAAALKPRWRKAFGAIFLSGLAAIAAWELFVPEGRSLGDLLSFQGPQASRLTLWRVAWHMFCDHPWTGVGPGHYRTLFSSYFAGTLDGERNWGNAHNLFLHQAAERGLVGLAALAAAGAALAVKVWEWACDLADGWTLWGLAACAAFLVMNMTETAFQTEQIATLFLVLVLLPPARQASSQ